MKAYHGSEQLKQTYLARVRAHREADCLVKGVYWENGKGCAIGCTIHGANHVAYETELGIPQGLAWLEDVIFENVSNGEAMLWPERFLDAIEPGADLAAVQWRFLHWLLTTPEVNPGIANPLVYGAVAEVAELMLRVANTGSADLAMTGKAERAAASAAWAAWAAERAAWELMAGKLLDLLRACTAPDPGGKPRPDRERQLEDDPGHPGVDEH